MCRRLATASAVLALFFQPAIAQTVSRAFVATDGKVHLAYTNGAAKIVPPEQQQVGCESISVAEDKRTVGWSVLVDNCCTSYPIPTSVVIYNGGKKTVISPGQMIYEWHFVNRGDRVAVLSGPVHGTASASSLYNARSGKLLASWHGQHTAPDWAKPWEQQFE